MKCSPLAVIAQKNSAHHSRQIASGHAVLKFLCALLMTLSMTANVWAGKGGAGGGGTLAAPSGLTAAGISTNQIQLSWVDNSSTESGFKIEQAPTSSGPWKQIGTVSANVTAYTSGGLTAATTY